MLVILGIVTSIAVVIVTYYKWVFQYWKHKGITYDEPSIPFGSVASPLTRKVNLVLDFKCLYDKYKKRNAKHLGVYTMASPVYMPIDLDFVKNIMSKDFSHFTDRGIYYNEKDDPLSAHLFAIGGIKWRNLRVKMTPTFTSGKMRMMFATLVECGKVFNTVMDQKADNKEAIDIKEELGRFTTDIIGSCAFGLEIKSIGKEGSPFRKHGKAIFERSRLDALKGALSFNFPTLARALRIKATPSDAANFFMKVVRDNIDYREKNNYQRNDFMQILIDLKNKKLDNEITEEHDGKSLTVEEIAAQCFVFFLAGFETSSTAMTFALLHMSLNQEVQDKVRAEINTVLEKYNGEVTYDGIMEMKYMGQVIDEALRMYPPVPLITRECVKDYKLPESDAVLDKGVKCMIPVYCIHHDENYYPDPEKFDPERFTEENKKNRHPYAFIPFGEGPRICIGMRFGYMQSKVGLTILLKNFRFTLDEKTQVPVKLCPTNFICSAEGGVWLRAERL